VARPDEARGRWTVELTRFTIFGGWSRILTGWVVCVHGTMSEGAIHTLRKLIAGLGVAGEARGILSLESD
jgi:hypothetical protein